MPESNPRTIGLVLSAGGARAAYQVGVLKYVGREFPHFNPQVVTGVSAGSINAAYLAQGEKFSLASQQMADLWSGLQFEQVVRSNFKSVFSVAKEMVYDMFWSKVTQKTKFTSILDASPLGQTLRSEINFQKISDTVKSGKLLGCAVTTTNYRDGSHTIFFESHQPIQPWIRENRRAIPAKIRLKHVIASCSIPILFEPVALGDSYYGDGALGFGFPFSPAIHLGATHLFGIGLSSPTKLESPSVAELTLPSLGYVAGAVLNSIFVDSLGPDYEFIQRLNELAEKNPTLKKLNVLLIRPSKDLGMLARDYIQEIPFHVRQLIKATAVNPLELSTLISYLMFNPSYINALITLGESDAQAHHREIEAFVGTS